jgi:hypothetical protein
MKRMKNHEWTRMDTKGDDDWKLIGNGDVGGDDEASPSRRDTG